MGPAHGTTNRHPPQPTQDCYHIPPEWLQPQNELLVWSESKFPTNVTAIDPALASVVYRVDPPEVRAMVDDIVEEMQ